MLRTQPAKASLLMAASMLSLVACAPESDGRSFGRAEAAMAKGDYATARIELMNAARERPTDAAVHLATATTLLELGDVTGGEAAAREAQRLGADAAAVAALLGDAAVMRGDSAAAEAAARQLPASRAADRARLLGAAAYVAGNRATAVERYREGIAAAPDDAGLHIELGNALLAEGDVDGAYAAAIRARSLDARRIGSHLLLGRIAEYRRDAPAALAAYDAAIALRPRNVDALTGRAIMLVELDRADDFAAMVPRMEEAAPNDPRTAFVKAMAAVSRGDNAEAHALLNRAGAGLDDDARASALAARVALDLGYTSIGVAKARRAVATAPGEPYFHFLLADALWRNGQSAEATTVMRYFDTLDSIPPPAAELRAALAAGSSPPAPSR